MWRRRGRSEDVRVKQRRVLPQSSDLNGAKEERRQMWCWLLFYGRLAHGRLAHGVSHAQQQSDEHEGPYREPKGEGKAAFTSPSNLVLPGIYNLSYVR